MKRSINAFLDILHRSVVVTCALTTVVGTGYLGYRAYDFIFVVWPERDRLRKLKEKELLNEGRSPEAFPDLAPTLKG